ncbi:hypothetical protein SEA_WOFFORD_174 [Streptomyces phage Wofford]|uniref:Uncharacterized protein n=1 Tax=Streptomyces phage Wofford TaxID=2283267 RepID=A0A345MA04_9CAUD|nr:hypothetical protein HWB78_gp130 [Streptomyces phage Wollford]AXH67325.1 hypothetical protein SEA_WOFFORD_174 [Streptomyces phage Wollford]
MACFEVDEELVAKRAAEMLRYFKSQEAKKKMLEIARELPEVAKVDYISLMSK